MLVQRAEGTIVIRHTAGQRAPVHGNVKVHPREKAQRLVLLQPEPLQRARAATDNGSNNLPIVSRSRGTCGSGRNWSGSHLKPWLAPALPLELPWNPITLAATAWIQSRRHIRGYRSFASRKWSPEVAA